jgi:nucleoside-diphosphate-sugar epimerase
MTKILITGASGFVGKHLLADMDLSACEVSVITRKKPEQHNFPTGVKVIQADLNDVNSLVSALSGIDILVNTAAEVRNASMLEETNIKGTQNLIQAIAANKIKRVIHLSSVGVVGMQYSAKTFIVDEKTACDPKNEYERTKLESERLLIEAEKNYGFNLIVLRPTNVFGEGHPFNALLNMMQYINSEKPLLLSKSAKVNYVYVKDLTASIIASIKNNKTGIFNVGNSESLNEFSTMIAEQLNKPHKKIYIPAFLPPLMNSLGIKKLNSVSNGVEYDDRELNRFFQYPFGLKEGLKRTIGHYKEKGLIK